VVGKSADEKKNYGGQKICRGEVSKGRMPRGVNKEVFSLKKLQN